MGTEQGLESGDTELIYRGALTWSFLGPVIAGKSKSHEHHYHYPPGLISLSAELNGRTALSGEESGVSTAEAIIGITYSVTDSLDIRGAYMFPVFKPKELDNGWIAGLVYHF